VQFLKQRRTEGGVQRDASGGHVFNLALEVPHLAPEMRHAQQQMTRLAR
jgi:hypothetical protein